MKRNAKIGFVSLGCSKNLVDTERMLQLLAEAGYEIVADEREADILIVNTCGFIDPAKQESIDTLLSLAEYKETGKLKLLVATGCLVQRYEDAILADLPEVDVLLGVSQYEKLPEAIEEALHGKRPSLLISASMAALGLVLSARISTTPASSNFLQTSAE